MKPGPSLLDRVVAAIIRPRASGYPDPNPTLEKEIERALSEWYPLDPKYSTPLHKLNPNLITQIGARVSEIARRRGAR